jgi:hypothetical protein
MHTTIIQELFYSDCHIIVTYFPVLSHARTHLVQSYLTLDLTITLCRWVDVQVLVINHLLTYYRPSETGIL